MLNYLLGLFYRFKNKFSNSSGNITTGKRRRDSFEDEDDEYVNTFLKNKRTRRNAEFVPLVNMSGPSGSGTSSSSTNAFQKCRNQAESNTNSKENVYDLCNDDSDIEDITPIKLNKRVPLSQLTTRHEVHTSKPAMRQHPPSSTPLDPSGGAISKYRNNGRVSTHLRMFKGSSSTSSVMPRFPPRNTGLNESIRLDEKRQYSELLNSMVNQVTIFPRAAYKNPNIPKRISRETQVTPFKIKHSPKPSVHMIDLTEGEDTHIPVCKAVERTSVQQKKVTPVNSFEKKIKSYGFISPDWITEMQEKYSASEREKRRRMHEQKIILNLYGEHNKKFNDNLAERLQEYLAITEEIVLDDTIEDVPRLPTLTPEMEAKIKNALIPSPPNQVLATGFGQNICRKDMNTLAGLHWLNDEVINFYMNLLIERGKNDNMPSVYAFSTFFYPRYTSAGHGAIKRWTKKVDIFAQKMVIVPIHLGMHWCMAIIHFSEKLIEYYDSMGGNNNRCLHSLKKYLEEESLDKKKQQFETSDWKLENVKGIPQQMNGSDCGMFSCMFAEYISRNAKITFTQDDMPYFRKKMTYEILIGKLLT